MNLHGRLKIYNFKYNYTYNTLIFIVTSLGSTMLPLASYIVTLISLLVYV